MDNIDIYRAEFKKALLELNRLEVTHILEKVNKYQVEVDFVEDIMVPVLEEIGDGWEAGTIALSQVYISGRICEDLVEKIFPVNLDKENHSTSIAIVTYDDYHPLGKKIVYSALRASGVNILDYGFGITDAELIENVIRDEIKILLISVLMLPAALRIKELKETFEKKGYSLKILVGGAPFRFDAELWKEVGADAMGRTPLDALRWIKKWEGDL